MSHNIIKDFIVFEGIDKSGKSTQSKKLYNYFLEKGISCHLEKEPTDYKFGKIAREELAKVDADEKLLNLLFAIDRHDHVYNPEYGIINKTTKQKSKVICDRYLFSHLAYQSLYFSLEFLMNLNDNYPLPQYLFYLSLSSKEFSSRISNFKEKEFFEKESTINKVIQNYEKILNYYKNKSDIKIYTISSMQSEEEIFFQIINCLNK